MGTNEDIKSKRLAHFARFSGVWTCLRRVLSAGAVAFFVTRLILKYERDAGDFDRRYVHVL